MSPPKEQGFPVVLKGESPDILHKTEAGMVKLNLRPPAEVERAFDEILKRRLPDHPTPRFRAWWSSRWCRRASR